MLKVQYWRDEFERLYKLLPEFQRKNLIPYDDYFLKAIAKDDVTHVKKGEAGLEKTRRVVMALQNLVDDTQKQKISLHKVMKRQKLVAV